ncbi:hypothetical protein TWF594_010488 [Orbilia oligospora]|nr:hypothetical protein TWF103_007998 [Orbilia oligospora]KAF3130253.1 hypothetical protein TWF594_010488 [Orbilia oligospora]
MNMKQGAMSSTSAEPLCSSLTPFTRSMQHLIRTVRDSQTHLPSCFRIRKLRGVMAKLYGQTHSSRGSGSDYSRLYSLLDSSKLEDFQDYFGYEVRKLWRRVIK